MPKKQSLESFGTVKLHSRPVYVKRRLQLIAAHDSGFGPKPRSGDVCHSAAVTGSRHLANRPRPCDPPKVFSPQGGSVRYHGVILGRIFGSKQCRGFAGWLSLPMSIAAPYTLAASADRELGLQFLNFCVVQRLYRGWSLGSIGLLPDLGLFCSARPNGQRLACLLAVVDTYGKAIVVGSGLL